MRAWWRKRPVGPVIRGEDVPSPPVDASEPVPTGRPTEEQVLEAAPAVDWGGDPSRLSG